MLEIGEVIKSNWVSSCIINTGRLNLTGVFWLMCMTGVLILEWCNGADEEWHLGGREELFALQQSFFFLPALWFKATRWWIPESKLWFCTGWKEKKVSRSQRNSGNDQQVLRYVRLQAMKKGQQGGEIIYLQQVNEKMKAESNKCDKLRNFLKEWEGEGWNRTGLCVCFVYLEKQHWEREPKLLLQRLNWERYFDLTFRS